MKRNVLSKVVNCLMHYNVKTIVIHQVRGSQNKLERAKNWLIVNYQCHLGPARPSLVICLDYRACPRLAELGCQGPQFAARAYFECYCELPS